MLESVARFRECSLKREHSRIRGVKTVTMFEGFWVVIAGAVSPGRAMQLPAPRPASAAKFRWLTLEKCKNSAKTAVLLMDTGRKGHKPLRSWRRWLLRLKFVETVVAMAEIRKKGAY